jgi:hypothetical protein
MRDAAHRDRVAAFFVPRRESNLQFARTCDGIFEKEFVEIAQPEEEERARMLLLEFLVLPQHRGGGSVIHSES